MESKREDRKVSTVADRVNEFLERLAYKAMETETLFIPASEVKAALEKTLTQHGFSSEEHDQEQLLKSATDKLGFLRAVGQCDESQLEQDHYFIHLSFQEFYVARYIARIFSQHPHSEEGENIFQCILTEKYTPRYQLMLWMSAGLLYQQGKRTKQFSPLLRFWRAILSQPVDMIRFHHNILVMHCLDECEADNRLALHKELIAQQCKWFEFYGKQNWNNSYTEQFARCSILLTSPLMVAYLFQALRNDDNNLRKAAIQALGHLNSLNEAVIEALLSALRGKYEDVRNVAASVLGRLSNSSAAVVEALLSALQDEDCRVRSAAAGALGNLNNPSAAVIEALLSALQDKKWYVRSAAAGALENLNNPSAAVVEALLSALQDEDCRVRSAAAKALGNLNNLSITVIEVLLKALQDEDVILRSAAAEALENLNNPSIVVIETLLRALKHKDGNVRSSAARALGNLNNPNAAVIEALLSALKDEDCRVRTAAARALGNLNNPNAALIEALLSALKDKDENVRSAGTEALGKLNNLSVAVIEALIRALQDEYYSVRSAADLALRNNPNAAVVEALLNASEDKNWEISRAAHLVLDRLGDQRTCLELQEEFEELSRRADGEVINYDIVKALLSTPKTIEAKTLIFKKFSKDEYGSARYFSCWFEENHLLLIDHRKGKIVARQGCQNYIIALPPHDLLCLEKHILSVARQQNYPSEFYNLSSGSSNHAEKAILKKCELGSSVCFVSDAIWLVHVVRKKIGQRALFIVEGMIAEEHIVQCYEFVLSQRSSNPSSGFFSLGSGIGRVIKIESFLDVLEKDKENYECKNWDIDPETGQRLLESLETDIGASIPYGISNRSSSGGVSASSSGVQHYDCLTWAEAKLEAIGLPVEGRWTDLTIVLSAIVAEQGDIAADSACEADPEPAMAEERDGKTEISFVTAPVHHAEGMAEKMRQRGLFVTAVPKQQIAQSEVGLAELEKSREELLKGTAYKKFPSVRNLEELNNLIERLEKAKAEFEELGDDFPAERAAHLKRCQKAAEELPKIDEKIKNFQKNMQYTKSGLEASYLNSQGLH
jgi:HEAT repeat protein